MVLELLFFSFLCGIFGSNLVAVPEISYSPEETLVLKCDGTQGVKRITLYDHDSDVFKPWHNVADCGELLFKGEDLQLTTGSWKKAHSMLFLLCSGEHIICDMLNSGSPYKKSINIKYGKIVDDSTHRLSCPEYSDLEFEDIYGGLEGSYLNIPIVCAGYCTYSVEDINNQIAFQASIRLGTLTSDGEVLTSNGKKISVRKPEINSVAEQGHRYIFKIAVSYTFSSIYAIDACLKNHPEEECIDYQIGARGKGNFDVISFPVGKNSIQNDAYVEIKLWDIWFRYVANFVRFEVGLGLQFSHRVNERILEQYHGKVFRKDTGTDTVDFHVLECEDGDISCDTDGKRNFKLTIYGVASALKIRGLYIQGVKINSGFHCTPQLSRCAVTALMEKHRHTALEYHSDEKFWGLLMADSDSYTAVFKDLSITAVADEET